MDFDEPLPLIERQEFIHPPLSLEDESDPKSSKTLAIYGSLLIFFSWIVFIITMNSLFKIWLYIIYPLSQYLNTAIYDKLVIYFEIWDYYVLSGWSIYVVMWWWAVGSWLGLKLFRHSKGIHADS